MRSRLQIHLRDINPEVVDAWRDTFGNTAGVEISHGDIFEVAADAIVSPANSFGYMDGGIDLIYSEHFGWDLQKNLQKMIHDEFDGELPVGQAVVVATRDARIPYLISAPTMRLPMNVAGTLNAYLAFRAALRAAEAYNRNTPSPIRSILCPGLGTAIGRMAPLRCARQMLAAYLSVVMVGADYLGSIRRIFEVTEEMMRDD
jgi:O-acetyl-ADP-ribose deacetylase (regulator of RNase III)